MPEHGWVRNWRKMEDWEWYTTPNMAHLFQHLIRKANHEDKNWRGLLVKRGQVVTSLESLRIQTGISTRSLRTCLDRMNKTGEITEKTTNRFRVITLCNYDTYQNNRQSSDKPEGNQATSERQTTDKQPTTNNNYKNYNNYKKCEGFSENQCIDTGWAIGIPEEQCKNFFNHYNAQGWVFGNGQPVTNIRSAMVKWKNNQYRFDKTNKETFEEKLAKAGKKAQDGKL